MDSNPRAMSDEHDKDTLAPPRGVANVYEAPTLNVDVGNDAAIRKLLEQARRADARQPSGFDFVRAASEPMRPATASASNIAVTAVPASTSLSTRASNALLLFALLFGGVIVAAFASKLILR